jgi:uncharacterized protein (DUF1015 family)
MARIQPFRAIRPNQQFADQLVLTKPQTASVAGEALPPLKTILETGARLRPETGEGQAAAFGEINETLAALIANEMLIPEENPGIYIYEVETSAGKQTGIWAATNLADYIDGTIKTHELTFGDSVRRLKNYREATGLEGSPVLLTYQPDQGVNTIIARAKSGLHTTLGNHFGVHRLWKIEDETQIRQLIKIFERIKTVYLADGHHRSDSATQLAEAQRQSNSKVFGTLSSLYMATDELRIEAYDRVVIPAQPINPAELLKKLLPHFYIQDGIKGQSIQPHERHRFGLYISGNWYHLLAKPHTYQNRNAVQSIDAAILQDLVLDKIFGITDPKSDPRLKCAGGSKAMDEIQALLTRHPEAIAFTLRPLAIDELIAVADAGDILPPKSTWIDPKVPYGLLLNHHKSTI